MSKRSGCSNIWSTCFVFDPAEMFKIKFGKWTAQSFGAADFRRTQVRAQIPYVSLQTLPVDLLSEVSLNARPADWSRHAVHCLVIMPLTTFHFLFWDMWLTTGVAAVLEQGLSHWKLEHHRVSISEAGWAGCQPSRSNSGCCFKADQPNCTYYLLSFSPFTPLIFRSVWTSAEVLRNSHVSVWSWVVASMWAWVNSELLNCVWTVDRRGGARFSLSLS